MRNYLSTRAGFWPSTICLELFQPFLETFLVDLAKIWSMDDFPIERKWIGDVKFTFAAKPKRIGRWFISYWTKRSSLKLTFRWKTGHFQVLLLMDEISHHYSHGLIHRRWCNFYSINRMLVSGRVWNTMVSFPITMANLLPFFYMVATGWGYRHWPVRTLGWRKMVPVDLGQFMNDFFGSTITNEWMFLEGYYSYKFPIFFA